MKIEEIKNNSEYKEEINSQKMKEITTKMKEMKIKNENLKKNKIERIEILERIKNNKPKPGDGYLYGCTLLDFRQQIQLIEWLGKKPEFELLYKATRDGFQAAKFHELCDGKGETFTIVRSSNGNIFDGYAGESWVQSGNHISSSTAFLFSFVNSQEKPFKFPVRDFQSAQYGDMYATFTY